MSVLVLYWNYVTVVILKDSERKILAFESNCYRKIMQMGWSQKVTNFAKSAASKIYCRK